MTYTIPEFSQKTGLTLSQVKMASYRKKFDCFTSADVPKQRGGAKRITIIEDTPRTMAQVGKLIKQNRIGRGRSDMSKSRFVRYESMICSYNNGGRI